MRWTAVIGVVILVFTTALILNLYILDIVRFSDAKSSVGKLFSVVLISTIAIGLIVFLAKQARK